MNFRLNSLHLGTDFDEPIEPLSIPAVARTGSEPALCILDGANRAPRRLSRAVRRVALLGLKVANPEDGVRVSVTFLVDSLSTRMWNRVHSENPDEPVIDDEFGRHRLIEVSAQGRSRGVLALAYRRADGNGVRQRLEFDLPSSEIGEAGLVMIGLEEPAFAPPWAREHLLEDGVVGLCVVNVKLEPLGERSVEPSISGGRPGDRFNSPASPGFFVINRGGCRGPVEVTLEPRPSAGVAMERGRRGKLLRPLRTLRQRRLPGIGDGRTLGVADVEAVSVGGDPVLSTSVSAGADGAFTFRLPAGAEPVYVRVSGNGGPVPSGWRARLQQIP